MRVRTVVGVAVVLVAVWTSQEVFAQQTDTDTGGRTAPGWWSRLWGKKAEPASSAALDKGKNAAPEAQAPAAAETTAAIQARAREALFRRQEVCDKLRLIALQTHDEALLRQAEQLNDRAWELYQRRTAGRRAPTTSPATARSETPAGPRPTTAAGRPATSAMPQDEQVLARHLGGEPFRGEVPPPPNFLLRAQDSDAGAWAVRREP